MEVVAEIGINHNGDIEIAKKLIDVAAAAGCDYVKFQKRDIDLVYSKEEQDKPRESPWGTTNGEQKRGLEFGEKEYVEIAKYCKGKIGWFASPWDVHSVDFLYENKSAFIKIPSALIANDYILRRCQSHMKTGNVIPFILSTGMSTIGEVKYAVMLLGRENIYSILHCTSTYPTVPDEINAECVKTLKGLFPWAKIGFSNHYPGLMAMVISACYGAEMIEFHITLDRTMYGSDQAASIEPNGVFELMQRLRLIERMKGDGVKRVYDSEKPILEKLRR